MDETLAKESPTAEYARKAESKARMDALIMPPGPVDKLVASLRMLIDMRNEARAAKNFAQADAIRKRLDEIGIILEDAPDGTKWRFK